MSHGEFVVFCNHGEEEVVEEGVRGFQGRSGMWEEAWPWGLGTEAVSKDSFTFST